MKVYIVGHSGPEHNDIKSIHETKDGALKAWNSLRLELIEEAKRMLKYDWVQMCEKYDGMYGRIINRLDCDDPEKIDNYPHETPYIQEILLEK